MKLRKLFAASAALALTLSMGLNAFAEGIDVSGVDAAQKGTGGMVSSDDLKSDEAEKGIFDLGSTDVVTYSDGVYTISTSEITVNVYPPFGWYCLTQDLSQQLDLYTAIFKDPTGVVQHMIEGNTHALMLDSSWNYNCELRIYQDSISALVGDSSSLSSVDESIILNHIKENCFSDCTDATADTYGSSRFYKFVFAGGTSVLYETYVNSVCIDFFIYADDNSVIGSDICSDVEYMLGDFSAS